MRKNKPLTNAAERKQKCILTGAEKGKVISSTDIFSKTFALLQKKSPVKEIELDKPKHLQSTLLYMRSE